MWDKSSDLEGSNENFGLPVGPVKAKTLSFTQSIKVIRCCMKEKGDSLHEGMIYSKVPEAKYTYIMCCTVATFLDSIVANPSFTEIVAPNLKKLEELLTRRRCQIIQQIEINDDYTEVKPFGVCFSIASKRFILNPISEEMIGRVTPRAYVSYKYNPRRVPNPKPFVESINNSFPDAARS